MATISETHELKALQTRLARAQAELKTAEDTISAGRDAQKRATSTIASLKQQISNLESKSAVPVITEHALLRYIERVYKIDLGELKSEILNEDTVKLIDKFPSGKIPSKDCRLVVKNRVVITVETND